MLPKGTLVGFLAADPKTGVTNNAYNYCLFSIYCRESFSRQKDEMPKTHFFNCKSWGKRAEYIGNNLKKNDYVFIEYTLTTSSFNNAEGKLIKATDLQVENIELLRKSEKKIMDPSITKDLFSNIEPINPTKPPATKEKEVDLEDIFGSEE